MLKPLTVAYRRARLADLGVLRVQGADAIRFLQGQVSNDVERLSPQLSLLAGVHTAQARAIALLRLVLVGPGEILAILPRELAAPVAARLSKFVLRAKAKVTDASAEWVVDGAEAGASADVACEPPGATHRDESGAVWVCAGESPARWLVATEAPSSSMPLSAPAANMEPAQQDSAREAWRALDIAAGIPQVYAATSEAFVAQMLNLDVIGGIAFDKGCYTGQEVIARAHYRGRVKRRMQRFRTLAAARLAIGDSGTLQDGRHFRVVDAVQLADGRCEFLAVAPTTSSEAQESTPPPAASDAHAVLPAEQLPLPYALPD